MRRSFHTLKSSRAVLVPRRPFSTLRTLNNSSASVSDDPFVHPLNFKNYKQKILQENKKADRPKLSDASAMCSIDLSTPINIPSLKTVTPMLHFKNDSDVRITTLDNGLRIASVDNNTKVSAVNVLFEVGTRYETKDEMGMSILLNKLSFKPSRKFSAASLAHLDDKILYESRCEHENLYYLTSFYRERLEQSIEMMSDTILYPHLKSSEIDATIEELMFNRDEQLLDPVGSAVLADMNMEACFGATNSTTEGSLGTPTLYVNESVTTESLLQFKNKYFHPANCVITGIGVDHDELVRLVEKHFVFENEKQPAPKLLSTASFISGDRRLHFTETPYEYQKQNMPALTGMIVSFEGVSVHDAESIFAIYVLESLLGGGNSFSSGGPGKGLQSLIYNEYLTKFRLFNMMAQHNSYKDTGVFSIEAKARHADAHNIPLAITKLCSYMTRQLTDEYVNRAKVQFKTALLQGLEDNMSIANSVGADVLYFNKYNGTNYLTSNIDKVTKDDIQRVMTHLLTGKPPAIAVVGDLKKIPPKEIFDNFFHSLSHNVQRR